VANKYIVANALHYCQRTTASGLLPADYCQLELLFDFHWPGTELVWKADISFGDKALGLKATVADVIHYCQLGKMDSHGNQKSYSIFLHTKPSNIAPYFEFSFAKYLNGNRMDLEISAV